MKSLNSKFDPRSGYYGTGGGDVHGVLDGTFDTTGEVKVHGEIGPNWLIRGGSAVGYRKVKKMVTETYSVPATRLVEREVWEPAP